MHEARQPPPLPFHDHSGYVHIVFNPRDLHSDVLRIWACTEGIPGPSPKHYPVQCSGRSRLAGNAPTPRQLHHYLSSIFLYSEPPHPIPTLCTPVPCTFCFCVCHVYALVCTTLPAALVGVWLAPWSLCAVLCFHLGLLPPSPSHPSVR